MNFVQHHEMYASLPDQKTLASSQLSFINIIVKSLFDIYDDDEYKDSTTKSINNCNIKYI